jgi:hypothetical protein
VSTKRSRNRDGHGRAQAVAPAVLPVVTPLCIGAFLAFTQRPRVVAPVAPPPPVEADSASASPGVVKGSAIDCNPDAGADASAKACKTCGVVKPLTEFFKSGTRNTRREACCKACSTEALTATPDAPRRASTITATSTATVTGKACKACGVVKPLALFDASRVTRDKLTTKCASCLDAAEAERAERLPAESLGALDAPCLAVKVTASPQLINVARLGYEARQAKTGRVYYEHGRVKIEAVYDRKADEIEYRVGGWPCPVDYLTNVFDEIHSGRPLGWL